MNIQSLNAQTSQPRTLFSFPKRRYAPKRNVSTHIAALFAVAALACVPLSSHAQTAQFRPAPLFDPAMISVRTLPNGVRSVVRQTRGSGIVAVQVWVKAGSRHENDKTAGASHLLGTLAMSASQKYASSAGGPLSALQSLGGQASSMTARDSTMYSATVAAPHLPNALLVLSDAVLRPRLGDADVRAAKGDAQTDIVRRGSDPVALLSDMAYNAAFSKHPYRFSAGGNTKNVETLTGATVRAYHKARYVGRNISVVIVGDVNAVGTHALVAQNFTAASSAAPPVLTPTIESAPLTRKTQFRKLNSQRSATAIAFRAPGINAPRDVVAMDVLLSHLSEGPNAALRRVLAPRGEAQDTDDASTQESGPGNLAVAFDAEYLTQRDPGLFIITLITEPEDRAAATRATLGEITKIRRNGITSAALAAAKRDLNRQYVQQGETPTGQAGALGFYEMIGDYSFATTYLQRVNAITVADIKRAAQKYLGERNYIEVGLEAAPRTAPPNNNDSQNNGGAAA